MAGYIKTYRKITNHWIWQSKPFSSGQAWFDILMLAAYKPTKREFRGHFYHLGPGQLVTSEQVLADRWGWSRKKVRLFLQRLESDKMLDNRRDNRKSIVTVCNWGDYQVSESVEGHTEGTTEGTQKYIQGDIQRVQQEANNNNGFGHDEGTQKDTQMVQERVHNNKEYKKLIKDIVEYLNLKTGKRYKHSSKATQKHIRARLNEGFTIEDFKKVIDNKCRSWLNNPEYEKYLRPETLFGTKFESYLNERTVKPTNGHAKTEKMGER